jgi:uncharacterized protein with NRDE domain
MLVLRNANSDQEGEWFSLTVRGSELNLKIRPLSTELYDSIAKKYTKIVHEKDPVTRQLVKREKQDSKAIMRELVDFILEDFSGVADASSPDSPLEVNVDNKMRLIQLPPLEDEVSIADFIFEKAKYLAAVSDKELKEQEKK